jgi:predicted Zn-dependent protease
MTVAALAAAVTLGGACTHGQRVGAETTAAKLLISSEQENQLGLQVQSELAKKDVKIVDDTEVNRYVQAVSHSVLRFARKDRPDVSWHVYVIDDPKTVNAFATPGGYLYVYTGLLLKADNDAEVAGVMGHEAGHVVLRHSARAMVDKLGLQTVLGMALGKNPNQVAAVAGNLLAGGTMLAHSRGEETEADERGVSYLSQAGYQPSALMTFFEKLKKLEGSQPSILKYLSDHPLTQDRIDHLQQYIGQHHLSGSNLGTTGLPGVQARIEAGVSSRPLKPEAAPAK